MGKLQTLKRFVFIGMLALTCVAAVAKEPTKSLLFFYKMGNWVDNYLTKDLDSAYIALPEHSWRLAFTTGMLGINSNLTSYNDWGPLSVLSKTNPSSHQHQPLYGAGLSGLSVG